MNDIIKRLNLIKELADEASDEAGTSLSARVYDQLNEFINELTNTRNSEEVTGPEITLLPEDAQTLCDAYDQLVAERSTYSQQMNPEERLLAAVEKIVSAIKQDLQHHCGMDQEKHQAELSAAKDKFYQETPYITCHSLATRAPGAPIPRAIWLIKREIDGQYMNPDGGWTRMIPFALQFASCESAHAYVRSKGITILNP